MSDTNINQITEKLLNNELKLSEISLEDFDKGRVIYSSCYLAQSRGFEAEHIVSVATQIHRYNKLNNTNYLASERQKFKKETNALDDRCYRLTPVEHLIRHYLKAKENPDEELQVFWAMIARSNIAFESIKDISIDIFLQIAELKKEACEKIGASMRGRPSKIKGISKKEFYNDENWESPLKYKHTDRLNKTYDEIYGEEKALYLKQNQSNRVSGSGNPMYSKHHSLDAKKKMSDRKLGKKMTEEQKEAYKSYWESRKEVPRTEEDKAKMRKPKSSSTIEKMKKSFSEQSVRFHEAKEKGTFSGTWNEFKQYEASLRNNSTS